MRSTRSVSLAVLGFLAATAGHGATLNMANTDFSVTGNELLFLDSRGEVLSQGFVALSTTPNRRGLLAESVVVLGPWNYPDGGIFASGLSFANDGSLNGVNLYAVIGNHADPFQALELGVLDLRLSFSRADTPPPPESLEYTAGPGSIIVVGTRGSAEIFSFYQTQALLLIPEPSCGLLAAVAGIALLLRRGR